MRVRAARLPGKPANIVPAKTEKGKIMCGTFEWTPARIQSLREDWAAGLTAALIARRFGIRRGSVIGKAHRLGLERRAVGKRPREAAAVPRPAKAAVLREPRPVAARRATISLANSPAIPLVRASQRMPPVAVDAAEAKRLGRAVPAVAGAAPLRPPRTGCGILDLTNESCRWPQEHLGLGDPRYCGEPGADLSARRPYCATHMRGAYILSPRPRPTRGAR
jgi:GcrA cell cycle regulator